MFPLQQLRDPGAVARFFGVKESTLAQWRWLGKGPAYIKVGGLVRYPEDALAEYVDRQRRTSTSDPGPCDVV